VLVFFSPALTILLFAAACCLSGAMGYYVQNIFYDGVIK
jgi:hypothetical protein